jgi:fluoride ion exporter CrcB/FEX
MGIYVTFSTFKLGELTLSREFRGIYGTFSTFKLGELTLSREFTREFTGQSYILLSREK